jgi:hypothetical protein
MLRLPLRYILPALFLPLTAALLFLGRQQMAGIGWGVWDGPPPRPTEIAFALSVPAGVAAIPGVLLFGIAASSLHHPDNSAWPEVFGYAYLAIFVFFQWFFIGRWLDRKRSPASPTSSPPLSRTRLVFYFASLCCLIFFATIGVSRVIHQGWMSTWIQGAGITAWSLIGIIVIVFRLRGSFARS